MVTMLNINLGKNKKLLEQCQTLKRICDLCEESTNLCKSMKNVEEAVDKAVTECINEGILREFLLETGKRGGGNEYFLNMMKEAVFEIVRKR